MASNEQTVKAGITMLDEKNYRVDANFRWLGSRMKETEELCLTVCGIERCRPDKHLAQSSGMIIMFIWFFMEKAI